MSQAAPAPSVGEQKNKLKRRRYWATIIILSAVTAFVMFSNYGVWTRIRLERKKSTLGDSLAAMKNMQDSLRQRIATLQNDTLELERIAREQYGMVKPGEEVFILKREDAEHK